MILKDADVSKLEITLNMMCSTYYLFKSLQPTIEKSVGDVIIRVRGLTPGVRVFVWVWSFFFFLIQLHFFRISLTEGKQMDAAEVCGKNMTNVTGRRRFKPGKCPDRNADIMYGSPL